MARTSSILPLYMLILLCTAGCGSDGPQQVETSLVSTSTAPATLDDLPAMPLDRPVDPAIQRGISVLLEFSIGGGSAFDFNGVQEAPFFMRLTPADADDLKYSIYQVSSIDPGVSFSEINIVMSELTTNASYFFAFADFSAGRWQLFTRTAPGSAMNVDLSTDFSGTDHVSPAGNVYIAVIADGAETADCVVEQLDFQLEQALGIPVIDFVAQGLSEGSIFMTFSGVPGAESYDLFYKEEAQPDSSYELLINIPGNSFGSFSHAADFPVGKGAEYGVHYEYRVRANAGLETSGFSDPKVGFRQTPQPRLTTTQRALTDRVELQVEISDVPVNLSLDLFRNGELVLDDVELLTNNGQVVVDDFSDALEPIPGAHSYTAIVNGPSGPSIESEPTTGCIAEWSAEQLIGGNPDDGFFSNIAGPADPSVGQACFVVYSEADTMIEYLVNGEGLSSVKVADTQVASHPEIANLGGRPWVAYLNASFLHAEPGLYVARGSSANPTEGGSFSTVPVHESSPLGSMLSMEVVDGRLAVMFAAQIDISTDGLYYAYANVPDPQQASDWTVVEFLSSPKGSLPLAFDFTELDGRPAGMYLADDSVRFFIADDAFPETSLDFSIHNAVGFFGTPPAKAVDVLVANERFQAAYLYGETEELVQVGYLLQDNAEIPDSAAGWDHFTVLDSNDKRVRDLALVIADDGVPLILLRNADVDWPELLRPRLTLNGNIKFEPWSYGEMFPNELDRNINQFLDIGIHAVMFDGQVHALNESRSTAGESEYQLHLLRLGLKTE